MSPSNPSSWKATLRLSLFNESDVSRMNACPCDCLWEKTAKCVLHVSVTISMRSEHALSNKSRCAHWESEGPFYRRYFQTREASQRIRPASSDASNCPLRDPFSTWNKVSPAATSAMQHLCLNVNKVMSKVCHKRFTGQNHQ